jgi:hypothetical protein
VLDQKFFQVRRLIEEKYSLGIVGLAINRVLFDEAAWLPVERQLTHTAPQAVRMPGPSIDLQQVLVSDALAARGAHAVLRLKKYTTKFLFKQES